MSKFKLTETARENVGKVFEKAGEASEKIAGLAALRKDAKDDLDKGYIGKAGYQKRLEEIQAQEDAVKEEFEDAASAIQSDMQKAIDRGLKINPEALTAQDVAILGGAVRLTGKELRDLHDRYAADCNYTGMRAIQTAAERAGMTVIDPFPAYLKGIADITAETVGYGRAIISDRAYSDNGGQIFAKLSDGIDSLDAAVESFPVVSSNE